MVIALGASGTTTALIMLVLVILANGLLQNLVQPFAMGVGAQPAPARRPDRDDRRRMSLRNARPDPRGAARLGGGAHQEAARPRPNHERARAGCSEPRLISRPRGGSARAASRARGRRPRRRAARPPRPRRDARRRAHASIARPRGEELVAAVDRALLDLPERLVDQRRPASPPRPRRAPRRMRASRWPPVTARHASSRASPCQLPPRQSRRTAPASASSAMRSVEPGSVGARACLQRRGSSRLDRTFPVPARLCSGSRTSET